MKENIKPKKLIMTKKNCKNARGIILLSKLLESLKFFIEKPIIIKDKQNPKIKE
tara:strand:- start:906 stop:1067 length:162 start_codon:yes stop_codon:yes gene_type:complete